MRPKKKQVHFRTPSASSAKASASSDETELPMIQLTQPAELTTKYLSLYSSSDTETDIPNAHACKYVADPITSDEFNDDSTPTPNPTLLPIQKPDTEYSTQPTTNESTQPTPDDIQPTPQIPDEMLCPDTAIAGEPMTSTPKESTGVYFLIAQQTSLSTL